MSGRVLVRMPPALHEALAATAAKQGVSVNQLVVALLAGGIGWKLECSMGRATVAEEGLDILDAVL